MRARAAAVAVPAMTVGGGVAARDAAVAGQWITEGGLSRVEVYGCGDALCGRIVWLAEPLEADGTPKGDDDTLDGRGYVPLAIFARTRTWDRFRRSGPAQ